MSDDTPKSLLEMIHGIPEKTPESLEDTIASTANHATQLRSEARRDATLAVALAIKRRGGDVVTGWTTKDTDTVHAITELLILLGEST